MKVALPLIFSLMASPVMADGYIPEALNPYTPPAPIQHIPVSPPSVPQYHVPNPGSNQTVAVTVVYDSRAVIRADHDYIGLNVMPLIAQQLQQQGLSNDVYNYRIKSVLVNAKSQNGHGQARLCGFGQPVNVRSACEMIDQFQLDGDPISFENPHAWAAYPLFVGVQQQFLNFPIDVQFIGRVRLNSVTFILEDINFVSQPHYPHPAPPAYPHSPNFLQGKYIVMNTGVVTIGQKGKLGKTFTGRESTITFENINYVFEDFRFLNLKALGTDTVIKQISVSCLDHRGYDVSYGTRNGRGQLHENLYIQRNQTLTLPVDRDCRYIQSIDVTGYTPRGVGRSARIEMFLE